MSGLANDQLWTADTGATSHMTPHWHWLCDYTPYKTPIRLTNNTIIYSAGVGMLLFAAELKEGCGVRRVLFYSVLHVPELGSNLPPLCVISCQESQLPCPQYL